MARKMSELLTLVLVWVCEAARPRSARCVLGVVASCESGRSNPGYLHDRAIAR